MQPKKYETYEKIKLLGEGSFGKAYLVKCNSDKTLCVIKEVDLSKMSEQERNETRQEAKILSVLKHPSIVNFREVFTTVSNKLCIVMDFADGGDLQKKIKDQRGKFISESQILDWFTQISLGLKHVHDRKIIHRDIKAQNVFLTSTNRCLLGDFGIAKMLNNTRGFAKTMVGTPYYLAPEIIESKRYDLHADIWSLGVLLYEMCALKPPFDAANIHALGLKIVKGTYPPIPSHYSRDLKNLISQMLTLDHTKRPGINQILQAKIIQTRIRSFLSETEYSSEFSHTILHKVNILENKENKPHSIPPAPIIPAFNQPKSVSPIPGPKGISPLPSARASPYARPPSAVPPAPIFVAHANKDRDLERARLERDKLFRQKEIAENKKKAEELERKKFEEIEKKKLEEADKKRIEDEKKRAERREEIKRLMPPKMNIVPKTPKIQVEDHSALARPKPSPAQIICSPIQNQPIVKKNDRVNQIKANFERQLGLLKADKKKPNEAQSASKSSSKKSRCNVSAEKEQDEEKRLQKAKEREELRKKMREDIKEQRKKISPLKPGVEIIQWPTGAVTDRNEHPNPLNAQAFPGPMPPQKSTTPDPLQKAVLPTSTPPQNNAPKEINAELDENKKKSKKSSKTKLKSKKKQSIKKNSDLDISNPETNKPVELKIENEEQKIEKPLPETSVPLMNVLSEKDIPAIIPQQKEIDNYMLMRQEMEKLLGDVKTPNPDDLPEDCNMLVKIAQENNEKDKDRDDMVGMLEEEKEESKMPTTPQTPSFQQNVTPGADFITPINPVINSPQHYKTEIQLNDKDIVKCYLEERFGREITIKIVNAITKTNEEENMIEIDAYHKKVKDLISKEDLTNNIGLFIAMAC